MQALADLFFGEYLKIAQSPQAAPSERLLLLYPLFLRLIDKRLEDEKVFFSTLFAKIAFVCHKNDLSPAMQWRIHQVRRRKDQALKGDELKEADWRISLKTLCLSTAALCGGAVVPAELKAFFPERDSDDNPLYDIPLKERLPRVRALVLDFDAEREWLLCRCEQGSPDKELVRVKYNEDAINGIYKPTVHCIIHTFGCRVTVNLLDVTVDVQGIYYPRAIIIEPDYLVEASQIAECVQPSRSFPEQMLLRRFLTSMPTVALAVGNIANYFLDELLRDPGADFTELFKQVFSRDPMGLALFTDQDARDIYQKSREHFTRLRQSVLNDFPENGIHPDLSILEPSFYAERYGIQGRLDLWQPPQQNQQNDSCIVELKSGSPFNPNAFGIGTSHYTQTLVYDLLVRSVFDLKKEPRKFILYSGQTENRLRYAASTRAGQDEALQIRNQIVALEYALATLDNSPYSEPTLLDRISPDHFPWLRGFTSADLAEFARVFQGASPLERAYFLSMTAFVARELRMSRLGEEGNEQLNGQASLWLNSAPDKEQAFELLNALRLSKNGADEPEPYLLFERTEHTGKSANFRIGDIVVVYSYQNEDDTVLGSQVIKGNIDHIDGQTVRVGLRYRQHNPRVFQAEKWRIEPDGLDSGFVAQFRSLFAFLQTPPTKRDLLLGLRPPQRPSDEELQRIRIRSPRPLYPELENLLRRVLSCRDYFLLVGPPGTGKTKYMLAEALRYLLEHTQENVLLMAYTNRAVDEICEAVEEFAGDAYLRLGSRQNCDPRYRGNLLSVRAGQLQKRAELSELIAGHRVFVATVSAVANNATVLKIKQFQTALIDEASQILEPMLAGVLPRFERFVLIGDHKQLPAVVQQSPLRSRENDAELQSIGLTDRRRSLFERLYRRAQEQGWDWATGMMRYQGRMHQDIMAFPALHFYEGLLELLPGTEGDWQRAPLDLTLPPQANGLERLLASRRTVYLPSAVQTTGKNLKINRDEAQKVARAVLAFARIYAASGLSLQAEDVGIITPFRAQIDTVRQEIQTRCGNELAQCSIDTVERYQGGAKDVIILSLCMNTRFQMENVVSLSEDGKVDRKLNVALTRARKHLVVVGNEALMRQDQRYAALLDFWGEQAKWEG